MFTIVPLFPGLPGGPELLIVLAVVVLLFGANKIPKLARSTGQAMGEFRRGREEIEEEIRAGVSESDEAARADDEVTETEAASA
jgi:sec-independent protein translocase protein TatA